MITAVCFYFFFQFSKCVDHWMPGLGNREMMSNSYLYSSAAVIARVVV